MVATIRWPEPVLCFDNVIDYDLLSERLDGCPPWLRTTNIKDYMDWDALLRYIHDYGVKQHHALRDALANQHANQAARKASGLDD